VAAVLDHDPDILVFEDLTDSQYFAATARAAARVGFVRVRAKTPGKYSNILYFQRNGSLLSQLRALYLPCRRDTMSRLCANSFHTWDRCPNREFSESGNQGGGCSACGHNGFIGRKYQVDVIPFWGDDSCPAFRREGGRSAGILGTRYGGLWKLGLQPESPNLTSHLNFPGSQDGN
jgi:hypothetical protein